MRMGWERHIARMVRKGMYRGYWWEKTKKVTTGKAYKYVCIILKCTLER
jgi:hypothetical protein